MKVNIKLDVKVENSLLTADWLFKADERMHLQGMNVRFFHTDSLKFKEITSLASGYKLMTPNPPHVNNMKPGYGKPIFGLDDNIVYINGAIEATSLNPDNPIYLDDWTKLFSTTFDLLGENPIIILDKQNDQRSFIRGSEGLTIIVKRPTDVVSKQVEEYVEHYRYVV